MRLNTRSKMRRSNKKAIAYLLESGFEPIYLIPHMRWDSFTYFKDKKVKSKDIFKIADGLAAKGGIIHLVQVKSNSKAGIVEFSEFMAKYKLRGIFINIRNHKSLEAWYF